MIRHWLFLLLIGTSLNTAAVELHHDHFGWSLVFLFFGTAFITATGQAQVMPGGRWQGKGRSS